MLSRAGIRSHLKALLAALVLAVACAALPAGSAAAAAPDALTATVSPLVIVYHGSATVRGSVSTPGAAVSLLERPAGAADWAPAGATAAGADGAFRFTVAPSLTTDYRVSSGSLQADVTLRVRLAISTSFPAELWLGASVLLRGAVQPAHPGGAVAIDELVDGAWRQVGTTTLAADSHFAFRWTPETYGFYRLRARMDADAGHDIGATKSRLVIVNRPNAHRVPLRFKHYIVIVRHEYRLYYYEHGALVRSFDVALGRPGFRTPLGLFHIYGKRKPAGGPLGACAMYYRRLGGIAIHGTDQPYLLRRPIPRDFSHGCARMLNRQVLWLYARVPVGTRVHNLP